MRRSRLVTILGGLLMAAFLLPSAVMAAEPAAETVAPAPEIKLGCALVVQVPRTAKAAIVCRWSALENVTVKEYRLWRVKDARPRELIATVTPDQALRHADREIRRGHLYTYRVVAIGEDGSRIGRSNLAKVHVGRPAQELRFNCAYVVDDAVSGVRCNWGETTRPYAVRYVLYRSVDGAAREKIYRTGLNGRRTFLDTDVAAGQSIRYAVVALTAGGRVVAIGGPDTVEVPAVSSTPAAR